MFFWNNEKNPETPQSGKRTRNSGNSSDNTPFQSPESSPEVQLAKRRPTMPMDKDTKEFLKSMQEALDKKLTEMNSALLRRL